MLPSALLVLSTICGVDPLDTSDGHPFGRVENADVEHLARFAKAEGLDLLPEMERAYEGDASALGRFFAFSTKFKEFDDNARCYGQVIWSSLLNLGEQFGIDAYADVIAKESPAVQQRVRDFLYYPILMNPEDERLEVEEWTREVYPTLFPKSYVYGRDDPMFARLGKSLYRAAVIPATSGMAPATRPTHRAAPREPIAPAPRRAPPARCRRGSSAATTSRSPAPVRPSSPC